MATAVSTPATPRVSALDSPGVLDTVAEVETPERLRFRYRVAGPTVRACALAVDVGIRLALLVGAAMVASLTAVADAEFLSGLGTGVMLVAWFALEWAYGAGFEAFWNGRTPGKWLLQLQVVRTDGAPIGPTEAILRNVLRTVDLLPAWYAVGVVLAASDARLRRFGDRLAGTMVVVDHRARMRAAVTLDGPLKDDELRALPPTARLEPAELEAIEELLRRREALGPERVEEIAQAFAPVVARRTGIEADSATRTLSLAYAVARGWHR